MIVLAAAVLIAYLKFEAVWLIYVSLGLLAVPFVSKRLAAFISSGWFSFSHYLGVVMNYVLMFLIFYLILCPVAFLQRAFGRNYILRKKAGGTNFIKRNHTYSPKDLDYPW